MLSKLVLCYILKTIKIVSALSVGLMDYLQKIFNVPLWFRKVKYFFHPWGEQFRTDRFIQCK
jgi:hypothetical protein